MSIQLSISTEEARALLLCVGFVRSNMVLDADAKKFRFVSGKPLELPVKTGVAVDFLKDYIETSTEIAINTHPLNPFISIY